ncbi:hypothetical protein [Galbibacter marinus]|nr:hypothetical protein [Galbibacter marinus]
MGQELHHDSPVLIYALKALVFLLIAVLSGVVISTVLAILGILN